MKKVKIEDLRDFLDEKVEKYNQPGFIKNDPIGIPHQYRNKPDIEIAGFFAAVLAWGQRVTIINKTRELLTLMDNAPHDFLRNHRERDLKKFVDFKHRTFNSTDTLYFIEFLSSFYKKNTSLESAFAPPNNNNGIEGSLIHFHNQFFSLENSPNRTRKHIATPERKSACKRLNMYLRWMVRKDNKGVDFGIWKNISTAHLIVPFDLHVERVARKLRLINRRQTDWLTAVELTENLRRLDAQDPVKYDFALFGLGIEEDFGR
jgi:uncharacterized protein (TIGR02757 family)